jgi:hypothetical protein
MVEATQKVSQMLVGCNHNQTSQKTCHFNATLIMGVVLNAKYES